jgi:hypothetical protein
MEAKFSICDPSRPKFRMEAEFNVRGRLDGFATVCSCVLRAPDDT